MQTVLWPECWVNTCSYIKHFDILGRVEWRMFFLKLYKSNMSTLWNFSERDSSKSTFFLSLFYTVEMQQPAPQRLKVILIVSTHDEFYNTNKNALVKPASCVWQPFYVGSFTLTSYSCRFIACCTILHCIFLHMSTSLFRYKKCVVKLQ